MHANPGYVLIAYNNWTIETSFWVLIICAIMFFVVGYFLVRLLNNICKLPQRFHSWTSSRKLRKTIQGLLELAAGNWKAAEKKLSRAVNLQTGIINYLGAAIAAQKQHQVWRRDHYLSQAHEKAQKSLVPGIIQAQLQIENKQWEEALATLLRLKRSAPRHTVILGLLLQVLKELQDFEELRTLLPQLQKRKVLSRQALADLTVEVHSELLAQHLALDVVNFGKDFWRELPRALRKNAKLVKIYANFLREKNPALAETLIKDTIHHTWDDALLEVYSQIKSAHPLKQLHRAEQWLRRQPENPALLLCLGKICAAQKLWGPARYYLEKSLKLAPKTETYLALGAIMENQEQTIAAMEKYKQAAKVKCDYGLKG